MLKDKIRQKIHSKGGFTLAEMLLAIIILLLVSVIMVTGIPAAKEAYEKVVLASNAEVLLSTTISSLRNELGTAQDPDTSTEATGLPDGSAIAYYNSARGATSRIYVPDDKKIMIQRYYSADGLSKNDEAVRLMSSKASTADLYVTYSSVTYANGIVTFTGLSVDRESGATGIAKRDTLSIRVINEKD